MEPKNNMPTSRYQSMEVIPQKQSSGSSLAREIPAFTQMSISGIELLAVGCEIGVNQVPQIIEVAGVVVGGLNDIGY